MGLSICVHNMHFVNTVSTILPDVPDQEVTLMLRGLWWRRVVLDGSACGPGQICLRLLHGATCKYEGVVAHVRGGEYFAGQVHDPVTDLVMTRRDEAVPFTIEGMANGKFGVASVTVMRDVLGI